MKILRGIAAVVAGLIFGFVVIFTVEIAQHFLLPLPGVTLKSTFEESMAAFERAPSLLKTQMLAAVWFGHGLGTFAGAALTAWIAREKKIGHAIVTGSLFLMLGMANLAMLPHPLWFGIVDLMSYLPLAWLAGNCVDRCCGQCPKPADDLATKS